MNFKEIIKRVLPFFAGAVIGLLITSIFMPIAPNFERFQSERNSRWQRHEQIENKRLRRENERLRSMVEGMRNGSLDGNSPEAVPYEYSSERCRKRHRKERRVRSMSADPIR